MNVSPALHYTKACISQEKRNLSVFGIDHFLTISFHAQKRKKPAAKAAGFLCFLWWAIKDLNLGLPPCEDGTLTTELIAHKRDFLMQILSAGKRLA